MGKVKSIGTIIRELYPKMIESWSYIKLCRKMVKDINCEKCKHNYACDCSTTLNINGKSSCTGTATAQKS